MEVLKIIKALSDENRLRILNLLRFDDLCVCEIENLLGINQSNASRHLNKLWVAGLIGSDKTAQWVFYKLNNNILEKHPFINTLLEQELDNIEQCKQDRENLLLYKLKGEKVNKIFVCKNK